MVFAEEISISLYKRYAKTEKDPKDFERARKLKFAKFGGGMSPPGK
ncbi:unnamed protein product, partial [Iphiclides podalirius]